MRSFCALWHRQKSSLATFNTLSLKPAFLRRRGLYGSLGTDPLGNDSFTHACWVKSRRPVLALDSAIRECRSLPR